MARCLTVKTRRGFAWSYTQLPFYRLTATSVGSFVVVRCFTGSALLRWRQVHSLVYQDGKAVSNLGRLPISFFLPFSGSECSIASI